MLPPTETTAFVLVPGSFSPASFYHKVTTLLKGKGYVAYETELLSVNDGTGPAITMYEDAKHINSVITDLVDQGKEVVLVANSYGGFPATESSKGLSKAERGAAGKPGGLVGIVYLASFVPSVGDSINGIMAGNLAEAAKGSDVYLQLDAEKDGKWVFSHIDDASKSYYAQQLKRHSSITLKNPLTYAGHAQIPATCVICTEDLIIPSEISHRLVDRAIEQGGRVTRKEMLADHCPMISHPEECVEVLLEAAIRGCGLSYN